MAWRKSLRQRVPGYQFSGLFKRGLWDGYVYPGQRLQNLGAGRSRLSIGYGFAARIYQAFPQAQTLPTAGFAEVTLGAESLPDTLRDYQRESFLLAREYKWGRLALATNAGKGAIIALLAKATAELGRVALILTDQVSVYDALEEELANWIPNQKISTVKAGVTAVPKSRIALAMVPTLVRRVYGNAKTDPDPEWVSWIQGVETVLLDEADKANSPTWQNVLSTAANSGHRIGFSGSFEEKWSAEELVLEESIGPVMKTVKNIELIERGISARPTVELYSYKPRLHKIPDWEHLNGAEKRLAIFDSAIVYNRERHQLIRDLLHPSGPNAVIVSRIAHGEQLEELLPDAVFLNGRDKPSRRQRVLERYNAGEFQNLIATKILDRGTNQLGNAVGLIFASGEGSRRQTLQRVGRGLRRKEGKAYLFLRDIIDTGHDYLKHMSRQRLKLYNAEGFDIVKKSK